MQLSHVHLPVLAYSDCPNLCYINSEGESARAWHPRSIVRVLVVARRHNAHQPGFSSSWTYHLSSRRLTSLPQFLAQRVVEIAETSPSEGQAETSRLALPPSSQPISRKHREQESAVTQQITGLMGKWQPNADGGQRQRHGIVAGRVVDWCGGGLVANPPSPPPLPAPDILIPSNATTRDVLAPVEFRGSRPCPQPAGLFLVVHRAVAMHSAVGEPLHIAKLDINKASGYTTLDLAKRQTKTLNNWRTSQSASTRTP